MFKGNGCRVLLLCMTAVMCEGIGLSQENNLLYMTDVLNEQTDAVASNEEMTHRALKDFFFDYYGIESISDDYDYGHDLIDTHPAEVEDSKPPIVDLAIPLFEIERQPKKKPKTKTKQITKQYRIVNLYLPEIYLPLPALSISAVFKVNITEANPARNEVLIKAKSDSKVSIPDVSASIPLRTHEVETKRGAVSVNGSLTLNITDNKLTMPKSLYLKPTETNTSMDVVFEFVIPTTNGEVAVGGTITVYVEDKAPNPHPPKFVNIPVNFVDIRIPSISVSLNGTLTVNNTETHRSPPERESSEMNLECCIGWKVTKRVDANGVITPVYTKKMEEANGEPLWVIALQYSQAGQLHWAFYTQHQGEKPIKIKDVLATD